MNGLPSSADDGRSATDRGQAQVVGSVLIVGVVVLLVATVGIAALSTISPEETRAATVDAEVTTEGVTFSHAGGESLLVGDLSVVVDRTNGSDRHGFDAARLANGNGNDEFEPGERWTNGSLEFSPGERVRVSLVDVPTGTVLVSEKLSVSTPLPTRATPSPPAEDDPTPLAANFTYAPSSPTAGETVTFNETANGSGVTDYAWEFGDGDTAAGPNVTHSYANGGDYSVTLTVTNESGAASSETKTVSVTESTATDPSPTAETGFLVAVQPSPRGGPNQGFVRLHFDGATDLSGWSVVVDGSTHPLPERTVNGSLYLGRSNAAAFASRWNRNASRVVTLDTALADAGGHVRLRNASDTVVDEVAYGDRQTSNGVSLALGPGDVARRTQSGGNYTDTNAASDWATTGQNPYFTRHAGEVPDEGTVFVRESGGFNGGYLQSVDGAGRVAYYDVHDPDAVGGMADLDNDSRLEVPYVKNGSIRLVDKRGERSVLVADGAESPEAGSISVQGAGSRLSVGDVDGDGVPSVLFASTGGHLFEKEVGASPDVFATGTRESSYIDAAAPAGLHDADLDGTLEVVYVAPDNDLRYYAPGSTTDASLGYTVRSSNAVSSSADFDGDGTTAIAFVNESGGLFRYQSSRELLGSGTPEGPLGAVNVRKPGESRSDDELAFVTRDSGNLTYMHKERTTSYDKRGPLTDRWNRTLHANASAGVAGPRQPAVASSGGFVMY